MLNLIIWRLRKNEVKTTGKNEKKNQPKKHKQKTKHTHITPHFTEGHTLIVTVRDGSVSLSSARVIHTSPVSLSISTVSLVPGNSESK